MYDKLLGCVDIISDIHELPNGHFTKYQDKQDITLIAKAIYDFSEYIESLDTDFLYVQTPYKICKYDTDYSVVSDFSNQNADDLLKYLKDRKVQTLDIRDVIHKKNINHYDLYYKTDHHWRSETGLWVAGILGNYLSTNYNLDIYKENLDFSNFNYKVYENIFLGSRGRAATLARAKPEDFTLITPKDKFNLRYTLYDEKKIRKNYEGDFEILLDMNQLRDREYYNKSCYHTYLYGDNLSVIENLNCNNDTKILIIADSYSDAMVPFLSLSVSELHRMDLRYFTGSLHSYIEKNGSFDAILMMYNPAAFNTDDVVNKNLFDFR